MWYMGLLSHTQTKGFLAMLTHLLYLVNSRNATKYKPTQHNATLHNTTQCNTERSSAMQLKTLSIAAKSAVCPPMNGWKTPTRQQLREGIRWEKGWHITVYICIVTQWKIMKTDIFISLWNLPIDAQDSTWKVNMSKEDSWFPRFLTCWIFLLLQQQSIIFQQNPRWYTLMICVWNRFFLFFVFS